MVRRHKKKSRKYLGSRSWGAGNIKNRRGKGNRGGKGRAGIHKHRRLWAIKYEPPRLRVGFPGKKKKLKVLSLDELNKQIEKGFWKPDETGLFKIDLSSQDIKILGSGNPSYKVDVKANAFSKKAREKIEKAGGMTSVKI
ncbi:uL15 family ribosomal protein [Candidatus Micrarchaeota archaeon]|nr:uL15 family ribosomal protein [Candidatus Micrarchaeota archaeon]